MDGAVLDGRGWTGTISGAISWTAPVIARMWSARAEKKKLELYLAHFSRQVLPELKALDGFTSALVLSRQGQEEHEIVVTTFWKSKEAITGFAGLDWEAAVVAPEAAAFLKSFDQRVRHYRVESAENFETVCIG